LLQFLKPQENGLGIPHLRVPHCAAPNQQIPKGQKGLFLRRKIVHLAHSFQWVAIAPVQKTGVFPIRASQTDSVDSRASLSNHFFLPAAASEWQ
jgi:hypothetical protein